MRRRFRVVRERKGRLTMKNLRLLLLTFVSVFVFAFAFTVTSENVDAGPAHCCTYPCPPGCSGPSQGHIDNVTKLCVRDYTDACDVACDCF